MSYTNLHSRIDFTNEIVSREYSHDLVRGKLRSCSVILPCRLYSLQSVIIIRYVYMLLNQVMKLFLYLLFWRKDEWCFPVTKEPRARPATSFRRPRRETMPSRQPGSTNSWSYIHVLIFCCSGRNGIVKTLHRSRNNHNSSSRMCIMHWGIICPQTA